MSERTERQNVKVSVVQKDIFGSLIADNKYDDDTVVEVIEWLRGLLEVVPPEYRASARVDLDSVGGYEGEHHSEIEVYYERPETDEEMRAREDKTRQYFENEAARLEGLAKQARARLGAA
ncbi:hypothetical protein [Bradyrhizobium sp. URHD0069]|uniref:hypothetical protein n=1 Tax=Bradyrhizobium sp. URHD0069 TaxID=1380355 RepID=UPI000496F01A|nr:hypothetical protein [Bradyrhizobium sp. URHD0069]